MATRYILEWRLPELGWDYLTDHKTKEDAIKEAAKVTQYQTRIVKETKKIAWQSKIPVS